MFFLLSHDTLNGKIGDIKNIAITAATRTASAIGASLEAILNTDCTFAGSISNGGKGTIVGYHYMSSGNHYWTALVAWFGRDPVQYQGMAGTYSDNEISKVLVGEADVTTSSNGNFSITGLSSSSFMLLTITVTSPDDVVAIPYKYGTGAGLLGGHAMSCLAAQTAIANMNLHIKYAYVAI